MKLNHQISPVGIVSQIFNHTTIKTFLTLEQIAQFKTYDEGYQRQRDINHENKIIDYLKNSSNRYLPDIIVSIRHDDINFEDKIILKNEDLRRKLESQLKIYYNKTIV